MSAVKVSKLSYSIIYTFVYTIVWVLCFHILLVPSIYINIITLISFIKIIILVQHNAVTPLGIHFRTIISRIHRTRDSHQVPDFLKHTLVMIPDYKFYDNYNLMSVDKLRANMADGHSFLNVLAKDDWFWLISYSSDWDYRYCLWYYKQNTKIRGI